MRKNYSTQLPDGDFKLDPLKYNVRLGKVRYIIKDYQDNTTYLLATDKISAFDIVMPNIVRGKGKILTAISEFWFDFFRHIPNHIKPNAKVPQEFLEFPVWAGRTMCCRTAEVIPIEFVVRGYLAGSGWKDYQATGEICGHELPKGMKLSQRFKMPIFTPATKAPQGEHDQNITIEEACKIDPAVGLLAEVSLSMYMKAHSYALERGIIIADTKFEWGRVGGELVLIDEVLTPDSSRFWPVSEYTLGEEQNSFDKQILRNFLQEMINDGQWDKTDPGPKLPDMLVDRIYARYEEIYKLLTKD